LAWNFERSDRARAAVLAALVDAKTHYYSDYVTVVKDLGQRFESYKQAYAEADMERGVSRLEDVTTAVDAAIASTP
jgi:hypothetical protein